jgi:hypothetical protein
MLKGLTQIIQKNAKHTLYQHPNLIQDIELIMKVRVLINLSPNLRGNGGPSRRPYAAKGVGWHDDCVRRRSRAVHVFHFLSLIFDW